MYSLNGEEFIFVFTGPDGSGRKTMADMVGSTLGMTKVVGCTTRAPRAGESEGQDYFYISRDEFESSQAQEAFLETIEINGNYYGIRNRDIEEGFKSLDSVYLILNPYGAEALKKLYGDHVVRIFVYADRKTVTERQRKLGLDEKVIEQHISHYDADMAYMSQCEHAFENIDIGHTPYEISNTIEKYLKRNLVDKD